ncbi:voltage-dependent anion channel [Tuber borchii]|uniref:Voltage-dependent anion channel n=1 Tax=Tuber borchii TaxID=42251 RepID=A0A2T6ZM69_TUBBO|nr:voltage-dependent anion channel [Tuber borchii]
MSGLSRRMSNSSQTSNSPLLPRSNGDGTHGWRDVLENKMTWAWYTSIMSSGGVALILYNLPYGFPGLWVLGGIIYIASLVGFILLLATHIVRFSLKPRLIRASITHPSEGLFVSTFAAALGILIVDGATYAEKMHTAHGMALRASFWIFLVVSVIFGVGSPLTQFSKAQHGEPETTPLATQTVLPLTLVGYAAATVAAHISTRDHHIAMPIIYMGIAFQGMGILVSLLSLSTFVDRLYHYSLPPISQRPSMYVAVGPPAFSALSFSLLAEQCLRHFPAEKTAPGGANEIFGGVALYYILFTFSLMLWGLSLWFFLISVFTTLAALGQMDIAVQQLQMFALIFPNVGFSLATIQLSRLFGHPKVLAIISEVLSLTVVGAWAIVVLATCYGILSGRIFRTV